MNQWDLIVNVAVNTQVNHFCKGIWDVLKSFGGGGGGVRVNFLYV